MEGNTEGTEKENITMTAGESFDSSFGSNDPKRRENQVTTETQEKPQSLGQKLKKLFKVNR